MERKVNRRWQLQDLLHMQHSTPITQTEHGDGNEGMAQREPIEPFLKGKTITLNSRNKTGLPETLSLASRTSLYRAINTTSSGVDATLHWTLPIKCGTQLKISLEDKQTHSEDDRRYTAVTLRAMPLYCNSPARDDVKVWIEEDAGKRLYFAKYVMTFIPIFTINVFN